MSKLAMENNAINLSQGYPDFEVDPTLINSVAKYMKLGFNQYAPMPGVLKLKNKTISPSQIVDIASPLLLILSLIHI